MNNKHHNPDSNTPEQKPNEPLGDRGKGDKTWSPEQGEQGISNRVGDDDAEPEQKEKTHFKGTDTAATTDPAVAEREKGKRTTM